MRAIIIEEDRFAEICDLMRTRAMEVCKSGYLQQQTNLTVDQLKMAADEMSRAVHFEFVRWAQSHGASCVRK